MDRSLRWDMVRSLRRKHDLLGMTKSQITELLGMPDGMTDETFSYYLGMARKGINTGHLRLTFGDDQAVTDVLVWDS